MKMSNKSSFKLAYVEARVRSPTISEMYVHLSCSGVDQRADWHNTGLQISESAFEIAPSLVQCILHTLLRVKGWFPRLRIYVPAFMKIKTQTNFQAICEITSRKNWTVGYTSTHMHYKDETT